MDAKLLWNGLKWGFGIGRAEPVNIVFKRNKQVQIWSGDTKEIRFGKGDDGFPIEAKRPNTPLHYLSDGRPVHVFVEGKPQARDILNENQPSYEDIELRNMIASIIYFNKALEGLFELPKEKKINWKLIAILIGIAVIGLIAFYFMGGNQMIAGLFQPDAFAQAGSAIKASARPV